MNNTNLSIVLTPREDKNKEVYHIGRICFPGDLDLSDGAAFLIFLSEEGEEELQIANIDQDRVTFSQFSKRQDRIKVYLEPRQDQFDKTFYLAKVQLDGKIDCRDGATFMVFTSKPGQEQLQIVAPVSYRREQRHHRPDVRERDEAQPDESRSDLRE